MDSVYQKWRVAMFCVWVVSAVITVAALLAALASDAV
jgi:hypothetical protein